MFVIAFNSTCSTLNEETLMMETEKCCLFELTLTSISLVYNTINLKHLISSVLKSINDFKQVLSHVVQ